ncbi:YraN family protein [Rhodococcus sp. ABRD24]|uniref:YraN family protein n=1 Tax=Rhodococcus sp. ABRD24 TaxID=2507582 RepID=UPI00103E41E8|nr:YraN family protein [Rhodococcus sp. ABRD24]QBJ98029.1 YraN family protein [Rhodococcus sp. ABRD24]
MRRNLALGAMGEELAVCRLTEVGLQILDRNWRCRHGELDVVAADGDTVVFVEVKTRSGLGYGSPAEAVTHAKQRRIRRLAQQWLAESERHWPQVRFDVVSVLVDRHREPDVTHLRAVF